MTREELLRSKFSPEQIQKARGIMRDFVMTYELAWRIQKDLGLPVADAFDLAELVH